MRVYAGRYLTLIPLILALCGAAALIIASSRGEASFHLLLFFPVITATGPLGFLGVLLLAGAFFTLPLIFTRRPPT
ncbi:MAG: hypothetical protein J7L61_03740, partial [Thermoplasmata archaeon]|nr:hypothetical protein [Thermoplasmata archaeon]